LVGANAGWFLSGKVTDPLVRLTAAAESITAGQQTDEHPIPDRDDEVGRLGHAFGIMARRTCWPAPRVMESPRC